MKIRSGPPLLPWGEGLGVRAFLLFLLLLTACTPRAQPLIPGEVTPRVNPPLEDMPPARDVWPDAGTSPDGYQFAAEQDGLRLFISLETGALIVVQTDSGAVWNSIPDGAADNPDLASVWKKRSQIPFIVEYTGEDRSSIKVARSEDALVTLSPVENGARLDYVFEQEGLALTAYITLDNGALQITIPAAGVQETGGNGILNVQVLPFFGAQVDGAPGYILYPDGSGMLMRFTSPHRKEVQEISRPVYGDDALTAPTTDLDPFTRQPVPMPVFGLTTGPDGFLGVITQGDFDATVSLARSGEGVPYNRVWAEFVYRRQGMFSLGGEQPVVLYEPHLAATDHQIRYYFLSGDQATYAGMAARYRAFLQTERGATPLPSAAPLLSLHFFMGVEQRNLFLRNFIAMTTFDQVGAMLDELASAGVTNLDVTLEGWNEGGAEAHYPRRLPVDARLGGADGLLALADTLHARGQRLFLLDNYLDILPHARGAFPITDAVRGVDGLPVGDADRGYYLNPQVALRQFAAPDQAKMTNWGVDGLYLQDFAALTVPDANPRYPLGRENFAASWMQIAMLARTQFGATVLDGGNVYALPFAARLENVPLTSTGYDFGDETVPFYSMVVHGLVPYTGTPINLASEPRRAFLHAVAFGAIPVYTLTYNDTASLFRTAANELWSAQFSVWREEIVWAAGRMEELADLQTRFIVDYQPLAEDVVQITYDNGTRVIVNFSGTDFSAGEVGVPADDFVVLR